MNNSAVALLFILTVLHFCTSTTSDPETSNHDHHDPFPIPTNAIECEGYINPPPTPSTQNITRGDVSFLLSCSITIFSMVSGLGFLYGGVADMGNVLHMISFSFVSASVVAVQWALFGYYVSFGDSLSDHRTLLTPDMKCISVNISSQATVQLMYAMLGPAIISGSTVGRMKLLPWIVFTFLWSTLVYDLVAYLIWNRNGYFNQKVIDFAGGIVIHLVSGFSGLIVSLYLGQFPLRSGLPESDRIPQPHNVPLYWLGVALLWGGWMAFNGAAAQHSDSFAITAIFNTALAGAVGLLMYMILESIIGTPNQAMWRRKPNPQASGAIYGLIAITPAAGHVAPYETIFIAVICTTLNFLFGELLFKLKCCLCLRIYKALNYDFLGVFLFHGMSGLIGSLLAGVFSDNSKPHTIFYQIYGVIVATGISIIGTFICLLIVSALFSFKWNSVCTYFYPQNNCICQHLFLQHHHLEEIDLCCDCCEGFEGVLQVLREPITFQVDRIYKPDAHLSADALQYEGKAYHFDDPSPRPRTESISTENEGDFHNITEKQFIEDALHCKAPEEL